MFTELLRQMLVVSFFKMPAHTITLYRCIDLGSGIGATSTLRKEKRPVVL